MKKILFACAALIILVACVYIFIPSKLNVSAVAVMTAPSQAVYRCIANENTWHKWMNEADDSLIKKINAPGLSTNVIEILITNGKDSIPSTLTLLPLTGDSVAMQWKFSMNSSLNPISRISDYNRAVHLKKSMDNLLNRVRLFVAKEENIYGFSVHESSTKDTILISTKTELTHYPLTKDIYNLIDKLEKYAANSHATITGFPMYNITKMNEDSLRLMTALPINKELPMHDSISPVRMVPGRFLTAQVTGGDSTVKNTFSQMQFYYADHNRTQMAIPFAYLITDRRMEPDTAKWITKIYAPVF
jgi:hypothetical protein